VHNEGVPPVFARSALSVVALTGVAALGVCGCSSGSQAPDAATSSPAAHTSLASTSPSPTTDVSVPAGTELTAAGSTLTFGAPANVVFEPKRGRGTVLQLTVRAVRQGRVSDFAGFILDDPYERNAAYYYATVSVKNIGEGVVGGVPVPLLGVNAANTLLPAVTFTTRYPRCPSRPLPARFAPAASLSTCLVYLSPRRGALTSVSYRPSQQVDPITWTGAVAAPAPTKPSKPDSKHTRKRTAKKR
jgi:hypothetical protein